MAKSRGSLKGKAGDDQRFASLFHELSQTVEVLGVTKTSAILRNQRFLNIQVDDPKVKLCLEVVSKEFEISIPEIIAGRGRKGGVRSTALGIVIFLMHYMLDIPMTNVAIILEKKVSNCTNMRKYIESLSEGSRNKEERESYAKLKSIKAKVKAAIQAQENEQQ